MRLVNRYGIPIEILVYSDERSQKIEEGRRQEAQRAEGTSHKGIRPLLKNVPRSLWLWRVPLYTLAP
jgi:hypothetical protein